MKAHPVFKFLFILVGCFLLSSCLKVEDSKGALDSVNPDPRVEGEWYVLKWMDQEKTADQIKPGHEADITIKNIERGGHTGYKFTAKDPDIQKDIDSLWSMNLNETRFALTAFPEGSCEQCMLLHYDIKQDMIYADVLQIDEAQKFLTEKYPDNTKIVADNTSDYVKELVVKTLDDEAKAILKVLAQRPELWENAVILKKKP